MLVWRISSDAMSTSIGLWCGIGGGAGGVGVSQAFPQCYAKNSAHIVLIQWIEKFVNNEIRYNCDKIVDFHESVFCNFGYNYSSFLMRFSAFLWQLLRMGEAEWYVALSSRARSRAVQNTSRNWWYCGIFSFFERFF